MRPAPSLGSATAFARVASRAPACPDRSAPPSGDLRALHRLRRTAAPVPPPDRGWRLDLSARMRT